MFEKNHLVEHGFHISNKSNKILLSLMHKARFTLIVFLFFDISLIRNLQWRGMIQTLEFRYRR